MPLPNIKKQCTAIKRKTGTRCKNPAAWGCKTCRYHGARRPSSIKRGKDHPQYRHGRETKEAREGYSEASSRLRKLEEAGFKSGLLVGSKTVGRKPSSNEWYLDNAVPLLRLLTGGKPEQTVPKDVRGWHNLRNGVKCWESADTVGYTAWLGIKLQ